MRRNPDLIDLTRRLSSGPEEWVSGATTLVESPMARRAEPGRKSGRVDPAEGGTVVICVQFPDQEADCASQDVPVRYCWPKPSSGGRPVRTRTWAIPSGLGDNDVALVEGGASSERATPDLRVISRSQTPGYVVRISPCGEKSPAKGWPQLVGQWKADTEFCSSLHDMAMHPAYQRIIGLGMAAVPLILKELQREPDYWFWALSAITGVDPVPPSARGHLETMAEAWLRWGNEQGIIDGQ